MQSRDISAVPNIKSQYGQDMEKLSVAEDARPTSGKAVVYPHEPCSGPDVMSKSTLDLRLIAGEAVGEMHSTVDYIVRMHSIHGFCLARMFCPMPYMKLLADVSDSRLASCNSNEGTPKAYPKVLRLE